MTTEIERALRRKLTAANDEIKALQEHAEELATALEAANGKVRALRESIRTAAERFRTLSDSIMVPEVPEKGVIPEDQRATED